jgi:hypothetical protein
MNLQDMVYLQNNGLILQKRSLSLKERMNRKKGKQLIMSIYFIWMGILSLNGKKLETRQETDNNTYGNMWLSRSKNFTKLWTDL